MSAAKAKTPQRQINSSPQYADYQLSPPVLPIRAGRSEALDALFAEHAEMKLFHPAWAEQLNWDLEDMRRNDPAKLARIDDKIEATARQIMQTNSNVGKVEADPNAPAYRYAANLVMASEAHKVPLPMLTGILLKESTGYINARSVKSCVGLMQLNYPVHSEKPKGLCYGMTESEVMQPQTNIWLGAKLYSGFIEKRKGDIAKALYDYVGDPSGKSKDASEYRSSVLKFTEPWRTQHADVLAERKSGARKFDWRPVTEDWEKQQMKLLRDMPGMKQDMGELMSRLEPTAKQEAKLLAAQYPVLGDKILNMALNGGSVVDVLTVRNALEKKEQELAAAGTPTDVIDKTFMRTPETIKEAEQQKQKMKEMRQRQNESMKVPSINDTIFSTTGITMTSLVTGLALSCLFKSHGGAAMRLGAAVASTATVGAALAATKDEQKEELPHEVKNAVSKLFTGKPLPEEVKKDERAMLNYERLVRDADNSLKALNMGLYNGQSSDVSQKAEFTKEIVEKLNNLKHVHEEPSALAGPYRRQVSNVKGGIGKIVRDGIIAKTNGQRRSGESYAR